MSPVVNCFFRRSANREEREEPYIRQPLRAHAEEGIGVTIQRKIAEDSVTGAPTGNSGGE